MIHFHKHDQTLIDICSLNKDTHWHLIVIPLIENSSEQMDSNFTFKLTANLRDSQTFATHTYVILDEMYDKSIYTFVSFVWLGYLFGQIYAEI